MERRGFSSIIDAFRRCRETERQADSKALQGIRRRTVPWALIYEHIVPQNHFVRKLGGVVDWRVSAAKWIQMYRGGAKRGHPPHDPVVDFEMPLLACIDNPSEHQTEAYVNSSL